MIEVAATAACDRCQGEGRETKAPCVLYIESPSSQAIDLPEGWTQSYNPLYPEVLCPGCSPKYPA